MEKSSPIRAPQLGGVQRLLSRRVAILGAALAPLVICGLLGLLPSALANTSAALILVLVIVAAACTGYRLAGLSLPSPAASGSTSS